ncbi:hypothetical protein A3385_003630 [Escherichia coli]|nr:hypothetical protein RG35_21110 [Escherichia coli]OYI73363.1 hypothetical protein CI685_07160 [Shigella sonnei]PAY73056.1 hypothetical protein CEG96_12975 [Shigella flexneri]EAA1584894.1 hypothetical protein [Escherichia coli]EAA1742506.1 hypothetical protein [Escherichia coli]
MLPSETMIWQPEFTDKTLSRKPGAVHLAACPLLLDKISIKNPDIMDNITASTTRKCLFTIRV